MPPVSPMVHPTSLRQDALRRPAALLRTRIFQRFSRIADRLDRPAILVCLHGAGLFLLFGLGYPSTTREMAAAILIVLGWALYCGALLANLIAVRAGPLARFIVSRRHAAPRPWPVLRTRDTKQREAALAELFGVSRQPASEAMRLTRPNRGETWKHFEIVRTMRGLEVLLWCCDNPFSSAAGWRLAARQPLSRALGLLATLRPQAGDLSAHRRLALMNRIMQDDASALDESVRADSKDARGLAKVS